MTSFEPTNELEASLISAQNGELDQEAFITQLMNSQVVVMLDQVPPQNGVWDNAIQPLILESPNGFPVLAVFSNRERSLVSAEKAPGYPYALQAPLGWLLRGIQPGVGLVMNPGASAGFEIPPAVLESICQAFEITEPAKS